MYIHRLTGIGHKWAVGPIMYIKVYYVYLYT